METFQIVPASSRSIWLILGIAALVCLVAIGILAATARGSLVSTFEISDAGLRLRGDLYGRLIPASAIDAAGVRVVDLESDPTLMPMRRTMGTAVPGYRSGWFRLRNGRKALLYLTDRRSAVFVPTSSGFDLLLSPREPERFAESLKAIGH